MFQALRNDMQLHMHKTFANANALTFVYYFLKKKATKSNRHLSLTLFQTVSVY